MGVIILLSSQITVKTERTQEELRRAGLLPLRHKSSHLQATTSGCKQHWSADSTGVQTPKGTHEVFSEDIKATSCHHTVPSCFQHHQVSLHFSADAAGGPTIFFFFFGHSLQHEES
ncbi:unnamed protein product [Rangifer tarandus platyrhynchus]|uniref:Uncharacterized protein n=1 Tax=Rangifer tarandus platyrhynchus TaxID=3082113 RepID=A0AC59Z076_RANTA